MEMLDKIEAGCITKVICQVVHYGESHIQKFMGNARFSELNWKEIAFSLIVFSLFCTFHCGDPTIYFVSQSLR